MKKKIDNITYVIGEKTVTVCSFNKAITNVNILPEIDGRPVTKIREVAFWNCESLESITIPDSVIEIGKEAFAFCYHLKSVVIPDSIVKIGCDSFYGCNNIEHVRFSRILVDRSDADEIFNQLFDAGLRTREILLRIPSI